MLIYLIINFLVLMNHRNIDLSYVCSPSESEITKHWISNRVKVSIICTAFNHFHYIESALNGFLNQVTDFPFEVIINDDCSTDDTLRIIEEYRESYPNIIKVIKHEMNQHSQGISPLYYLLPEVRGDYVAICEGDDYWINATKLQKQFDCLEETSSMLCIHSAFMLEGENVKDNPNWEFPSNEYNLVDIFRHPGQFSPTSSYFMNAKLFDNLLLKDIVNKPGVGDFFIEFFSAIDGKSIMAFNEKFSVYRTLSINSWSLQNNSDVNKKLENTNLFLNKLDNVKLSVSEYEVGLLNIKIAQELQDVFVSLLRKRKYLRACLFIWDVKSSFGLMLFVKRLIGKL
ncbi:glycosyltransferase family 2 protein [Shewanella alkalitolerans]|uniref:glycosyltransferase family 2 protein n=1 Tax=Shewanella alkalitolerans TaxID=2864209 RepID=UPI001C65E219|nr:glycosyltransferase family A protein [Shewanella alkalitolerans]QYJ98958.1 glycosyltransferase family 2 protein [Shewanella alkalitolerans]